MANRVCIVSFADQEFAQLLYEMVLSVRRFPQSSSVDICIFDNGMDASSVASLRPHVARIAPAEWNFPHPFLRRRSRWRRARTAAPFCREYFPGYDTYVWIDADAWVADWAAVQLAIDWSSDGSLAIAPEADRAYANNSGSLKASWLLDRPLSATTFLYRNAVFSVGRKKARALYTKTLLNAGVWGLRADAPHWEAWKKYMKMALDRGNLKGDQIPLNLSVYLDGLPVNRLPARCNWLVSKGLPLWDSARACYVEPERPYEPIGVLHLAGKDAWRLGPPAQVEIGTVGGGRTTKSLRFEEDGAGRSIAAE